MLDRLIEMEQRVSLKRLVGFEDTVISAAQSDGSTEGLLPEEAQRRLSAVVHVAREDKIDRVRPGEAVRQEDQRGRNYQLVLPLDCQKNGEVCDDERVHSVSGKVSASFRKK